MAVWALIGFMGCGKSSIGHTAAKMLGVGGVHPQAFASLTLFITIQKGVRFAHLFIIK